MTIRYRPTFAEIDLEALRHNAREIRKKTPPGVTIMAIVKANAYGHGALMCSRVLKAAGVEALGVATVEEGMELRNGGIRGEIFVLGGLMEAQASDFLEYKLTPVLFTVGEIERLGRKLAEKDREMAVHLKLDTGMGRLGFLPSQIEELTEILKKQKKIHVEGVLTHLARADEPETEPTDRQFLLFEKLIKILAEKGIAPRVTHIANSAAIIDGRFGNYRCIRPGLMLYGAYPHPRHREKISLKPVMRWVSRILSIKKFSSGSPLSYGGTFVTQRESRIAIVACGYADGYYRQLSNKAQVLVGGMRAPVVGRVCMDLTLVDITDIPAIEAGAEVVLIGSQKEERITAEELAEWRGTISYEIFCGVSSRVPRVYKGA